MILEGFRRLREAGVLGLNMRNTEYIMKLNRRSAYPLVDNKIFTKRLAEKHNVPTPSLYHVVEYHGDISSVEEKLGERRTFVVKPARGVGGSGILLITDRAARGFVDQKGQSILWTDLAYHISDILSGIFSLGGIEDEALFEALVLPHPVFAPVTYEGVPDIRIVVYRGVPLMGMVRLPTIASDGKANLHRGAIGVGIAMDSGLTLHAVHHTEIVERHPDTGRPVGGIRVPYWEKILLMAALASDMTGLGYIGVDIVIDREGGPLLLEMNARPGLSIQLANLAGLRKRLEDVDKAPPEIFTSPEARVAWVRRTFEDSRS